MLSKSPKVMPYKYLIFIAMFLVTIELAAVAVAYKLVTLNALFEINSGATFIFPITYAIGDVVTEVYGYSMARKLIWLSLLLQFIYAVLITIAIHLPSPAFWHGEEAYLTVFGSIIRFVLSGTLAALVSSFINIYIVSKLKIPMEGKLFWLRSMFSILIGGLLLVMIVVIIGFSGKEINLYKSWIMIKSSYSMEVLYAFLLVGPAAILAKMLKQKEGVDVYDHNTNFNPFALKDLNKA